jgi:hypothetical protein
MDQGTMRALLKTKPEIKKLHASVPLSLTS